MASIVRLARVGRVAKVVTVASMVRVARLAKRKKVTRIAWLMRRARTIKVAMWQGRISVKGVRISQVSSLSRVARQEGS